MFGDGRNGAEELCFPLLADTDKMAPGKCFFDAIFWVLLSSCSRFLQDPSRSMKILGQYLHTATNSSHTDDQSE